MEILWIVIPLLAVIVIYLFLIFPALRRHPDRKILNGMYIAHRGLHSLKPNTPENSLAAFREAVEHNIAIEIDIHITADNEVVVFHDDNLKRMCSLNRVIETMTLAEIKKLRLSDTDEKIPTLKETLMLVDGRVPLMIEFKTISLETCSRLCKKANEILKDYKGKYFIQSFFPFVLYWYRKNRKDIIRGQLSSWYGRGEALKMKLLGKLVFNFIARPDFISYEYMFKNKFGRRLCVFLGAYSVGWVFKSQREVNKYADAYPTRIFENFLPCDNKTEK